MKNILCLEIIMILFLSGCKEKPYPKPAEFFLVQEDYPGCQNFVIANAPKDPEKIKVLIEAHNKRTIVLDDLKENGDILRWFYRETKYLTRNFKAGELYPVHGWFEDHNGSLINGDTIQELRNHDNALLASITYSRRKDGSWWYRYTYWVYGKSDLKMVYENINDIDAYFGEPQL